LYGIYTAVSTPIFSIAKDPEEAVENNEEKDERQDEDQDNDEDEDDESDDDVQITIGDIKSGPAAYAGFNVKRGTAGTTAQGLGEKSKVYIKL